MVVVLIGAQLVFEVDVDAESCSHVIAFTANIVQEQLLNVSMH